MRVPHIEKKYEFNGSIANIFFENKRKFIFILMDTDTEHPVRTPPSIPYRNTLGSIVLWTILRTAGVIAGAWILFDLMTINNAGYALWWAITGLSLYAVVFHPTQIQYLHYREETKNVMTGTLCASCKHFEPTGVLCSRLDEHVSEDYLPCEGQLWEPTGVFPGDDDE
jgi:hypothetical protein